ncbi:MAG: DUF3667 domain-containing protein [Bacteroidaceae bacterium]|nr:DUF3667 domain-containing protein [Bacteroidaceae bacterium]
MSVSLSHRICAWWRRLDERQQRPTVHTEMSDETHTCVNCGTAFVGRFCPQCGLRVRRRRTTTKDIVQEFLEIWDLGSRTVFRTIYELFWRPGYMIRDYLNGHQPFYYSPFKMVVFATLIFALIASLRGIEPNAGDAFVYGDVFQRYSDTPWVISFFARIDRLLVWLYTHPAYQTFVAGIFYIVASWIVFLRRMTFFEVFFSQLYISCQMQIVGALWVLVTGSEAYYNVPPFAVPILIGVPLLCYDYAQLYRLPLWPALWRTVLTFVLTLLLMLTVGALPILLVKIF